MPKTIKLKVRAHTSRRRTRLLATALAACFIGLAPIPDGRTISLEYEVKAALMYKFLEHTTWPSASFPQPSSPYVICVYGSNPFGESLTRLSNKRIRGKSIRIDPINSLQRARGCHILFVGQSKWSSISSIVDQTQALPVLTISESPNFIGQGGLIEFVVKNKRIGFAVNQDSAKNRGLNMAARLLALAAK